MHHDPELDGPEVASASPRSFAYLLAAVALIVGIYPLAAGGAVRPLFLALAALAFLIGKFAAALLSAPTRWWIGLGNVLSRIVSPVALLVVFGLMSAYGAVLRVFRRDALALRPDPQASTYWCRRDNPRVDFERMF
jgi:hypothetical protein